MSELVAFLRARLAEDEETASATAWSAATATSNSWSVRRKGPRDAPAWSIYANDRFEIVAGLGEHDAEHIARHDPDRALEEVVAKHRIMDEHAYDPLNGCRKCADGIRWVNDRPVVNPSGWPCLTLRALALPYAGHPDYRDEWRLVSPVS